MSSSKAVLVTTHSTDLCAPLRQMYERTKRAESFSDEKSSETEGLHESGRERGRSPTVRLDATNGTYTTRRILLRTASPTCTLSSTIVFAVENFGDLFSIRDGGRRKLRSENTGRNVVRKEPESLVKPKKQHWKKQHGKKQRGKKPNEEAKASSSQMADASRRELLVRERNARAAKRGLRALSTGKA